MAVYEALAAGVPTLVPRLPVLTTQFPALPAHGDCAELRVNAERLLENPEIREELVTRCRDRLRWADRVRHDAVFREAISRLVGGKT